MTIKTLRCFSMVGLVLCLFAYQILPDNEIFVYVRKITTESNMPIYKHIIIELKFIPIIFGTIFSIIMFYCFYKEEKEEKYNDFLT